MRKCTAAMLALFLLLVITTVMVDSFTFPGDWHKIRQMMEARKEKESAVIYYLSISTLGLIAI